MSEQGKGTSEFFVSINMEKLETVQNWLNGLVGYAVSYGKIVKILEWQVVPTGRPYEYSAFARVELQHNVKE